MFDQVVGSNGLYSRYTLPYFLTAQRRLGVTAVAFHHMGAHLWLDHYRCVGRDEAAAAFKHAGIRMASFHPGRYHYSLYAHDGTLRQICTMEYYRRCIDMADSFECPLLVLRPTGALLDGCRERDMASLQENVYRLQDYAARQHVQLCLQTVTQEESPYFRTLEELHGLLAELPSVGAALDSVCMSSAGESITQWFSLLGERIKHVTFQDGRGDFPRIWGEGVYPSESYAQELLESGYGGVISIIGRTDRYQDDPFRADKSNRDAVCRLLRRKAV